MSITSTHAWNRMFQRLGLPRQNRKHFAFLAWRDGTGVGVSDGKIVKDFNGIRCVFAENPGKGPTLMTVYKPTERQIEEGV